MKIKNIDGDVIKILNFADLYKADLYKAYLRGADLTGANLSFAYLSGADLINANLRWSDLRRANLNFADLRWSDLFDADLSGADLGKNVRLSFSVNNFAVQLIGDYLSIGCKTMLTKEFIKPKIWKKLSIKEGFDKDDVKFILKKVIEFLRKEKLNGN